MNSSKDRNNDAIKSLSAEIQSLNEKIEQRTISMEVFWREVV